MPTQPRTIDRLRLTDFRSYALADITAGPGAVVLTGDNGAGKTNLLEAISLLAPGRGLRRAGLPEMARIGGSGGFAVSATLGCGAEAPVEIGTGTQAEAPGRRLVRVNGAGAAANALSEWLSVLWLTPAMDRLFLESAGGRRRFLDRLTLALVPQHAGHTQRYDAAMQSRNKLLGGERAPDTDWLASLEKQMAEHGAAVDAARRMAIEALGHEIAASDTGPFPKGALLLEGEAWQAGALAEALGAARRADTAAGVFRFPFVGGPVATAKRANRATANRRRSRSNAPWNPKASRAATPPSASVPCNAAANGSLRTRCVNTAFLEIKKHVVFPRRAPPAAPNDATACLVSLAAFGHRLVLLANPAARPQATPSRTSRRAVSPS